MVSMKIILFEDYKKIANFIERGLKEAGFQTLHFSDGREARDALLSGTDCDLVILDLMLPGLDGLTILNQIRTEGISTPVLILSAKRSVNDRVSGLEKGGDDYLTKPFAFSELLARIQVLLRRRTPQSSHPTSLTQFGIHLDLVKRVVTREDESIDLQAKEFALLEYFMRNPERVLSKTLILEQVYGYNFDTQTNVVDVLVCRLRNKIDKNFQQKTIHTIRGVGYVLRPE
jgi:two-component system OmpR family response regulator